MKAYPAVFLLTGANDARVDPYNSRKMAARLQAATSSGLPVLLRTTFGSGHGVDSSLSERIEEQAEVDAFLFHELGMEYRPVGEALAPPFRPVMPYYGGLPRFSPSRWYHGAMPPGR